MIEIRSIERPEYTDFYLTAAARSGRDDLTVAQEIYAKAAAFLAEKRIQPVIEKAFGRVSRRAEITEVRRAAFAAAGLPPDLPYAFLEGAPVHDGPFAGLQIWGVAPSNAATSLVRSETLPAGAVGRLFEVAGSRLLYAPAIHGLNASDGASPTAQAATMFDRARDAALAAGFTYRDVIRTWIYLARILDWYGDFNRVRTAFFGREGLGADPTRPDFPASTGIQGRAGDEACVMDLLALQADPAAGVTIEPVLATSRQNSPFQYGSAFSRAMAVRRGGLSTIYISGTASVNCAGQAAHLGDPGAQAWETLMCIAALLEDQGGGLPNIVQATCYVKNAAALAAYRDVVRLLHVPRFPTVTVVADVCRDEWLVEIEAVAIV